MFPKHSLSEYEHTDYHVCSKVCLIEADGDRVVWVSVRTAARNTTRAPVDVQEVLSISEESNG